jgi:heme/copper-type cytochrome/quinol oxidase subunit 2
MLFKWNNSKIQMYISHKEQVLLEVVWTLFPIVILIFVAISSLSLLYSIEEGFVCKMSAHIVGHQWYWTYYYPLFNLQFDSCMIPESDLKLGELRLLEVDNRFCLPFITHLRLLLTSADVIHSWAVPSFGIKLDACPGRLTQCHLFCKQIGIYTGQCSEICGVGHAFMPISVQMIDNKSFFKFISVVTPIHEERPCFDLFPIKK